MPRTRSLAWSELKIGIVAVVALALTVLIIVSVGGAAGFSWQRYELKTRFPDVKGLKSGAVVRVAGVEVGKVTEVALADAEVEVVLEVKKGNEKRITTESRASIGSLSLLGEPVIDVSPATSGTPLKSGDTIPSVPPRGELADTMEEAKVSLEQLSAILADLRAGKGTLGKLFTDDSMHKEINALLASTEGVMNGIRQGRGTLGKFANDPQAYNRLNASLGDLQELMRGIRAGEGSFGKLLKDEAFAKSLTATTSNFETLSGRMNRNDNTVGKLFTEKELYDRFNVVLARLDKIAADIQNPNGSMGQFLQNKELYENINGAAKEARELIANIKKDPKKYLNVRVSIF